MKKLITLAADIDKCPYADPAMKASECTIGDLHGNALKLLYFLVKQGIVALPPSDYSEAVTLYHLPAAHLEAHHLTAWDALIDNLTITNQHCLVRLIGDELADRGSNDYFTLKILSRLLADSVPLTILLSNHGVTFFEGFETFNQNQALVGQSMSKVFTGSMHNLSDLLLKQLVSFQTIKSWVNTYKKCIKLIDYTLDKPNNEIILYSHAPIGLDTLPLLAKLFEVIFDDSTLERLTLSIDRINQQFQIDWSQNELSRSSIGGTPLSREPAIQFITWNRSYTGLVRPAHHRNYCLSYVHGHDSTDPGASQHIISLDNLLGKSRERHRDNYLILLT